MSKTTIFSTNIEELVELSSEPTLDEVNESVSSTVVKNDWISWTKFVLTDNLPNENKQRVPEKEFENLIKTGIYMPFKMAYKEPKDDHSDAFPLGVIAHLKRTGNQIVALAALWKKEREEDIAYLKECMANKIPVNVSWEIMHEDSEIGADGVEDLIGTSLRGVTVVRRPAYAGRTPVLEVASTDGSISTSEENTLDELEQLKEQIATLKTELSAKEDELLAVKAERESVEAELVSLRNFKAEIDRKVTEEAFLSEIKGLFAEAGINKPAEYFETNRERLLSMDLDAIKFLVQELVAFPATEISQASTGSEIPPVPGSEGNKEFSISELAEELRKIR